MPKFRKKPVVIEAVQLTWANWSAICDFVPRPWFVRGVWLDAEGKPRPESEFGDGRSDSQLGLIMRTLESQEFLATGGYWIIKGVQGEFYPCKPDIFAATYEPEEHFPDELTIEVAPGQRITAYGTKDNLDRHRRFIEMHRDEEPKPHTAFGGLAGGRLLDRMGV